MKNKLLTAATTADIEAQVEKVLRGLGNPEPPLDLDSVRALLKLDRQFYSTSDTSLMAETLSRLRIAAKQVIARPTLLLEAVTKFELRALWLPDGRRILIDKATPSNKLRWTEAHEVIHGILEWHAELLLGDNEQTLSPSCHEHLEAEANYGAGQLLFLRRRFLVEAADMPPTIGSVRSLAKEFGNTLEATLWRLVETGHADELVFAVITPHPHPRYRPADFDPRNPCRYFIRSPAFAARFSKMTEISLFNAVQSYCGPMRGGPLGEAALPVADDNGDTHIFRFETFYNGHHALTIAAHQR